MDTIPMYAEANSEIIGFPYPDSFQIMVNGLSEKDFAQKLVEEFKLNMTADEFVHRRAEILQKKFLNTKLVPYVDNVVLKLKEMGLPLAVATGSHRDSHELKKTNLQEFFKNFSQEICGDEVAHAKPSPEIFLKAAAKLGDFKPENILIFEDSYNGIVAANTAGMASVFLASGTEPYEEYMKKFNATPSYVVRSFKDFDFNVFDWEP
ncbi:haloacid dehalogenase-like hydrolase family protein [Histomonas meleagridis]|uniref:haloacid dehalogenase-like hydrolase family protein n=1 Tax=Histomonas meleagridis TaxID=135588 RepID=UPI00355AB68E|nr:haloacid dehalogenase-like hydrolase family protein [Histomonas meleagridis]KAH0801929.1 haloacid dehalogenase-like hydrolase family protein [Histomonas meleagridis]